MNRVAFNVNFGFGALVGAVLMIAVNLLPFAQDQPSASWAAGFPFEFYNSVVPGAGGVVVIALIADIVFVVLAAGFFGFAFAVAGRIFSR